MFNALTGMIQAYGLLFTTRTGEAFTALVRYIRHLVLWSTALVVLTIGTAFWLDMPAIVGIALLLYNPFTLIMALNRRLLPSVMLATLVDTVKLGVGGHWRLHLPGHDRGIIEYTGPAFPENMTFLVGLVQAVFYTMMFHSIALFLGWLMVITGSFALVAPVMAGLVIWLMLSSVWGSKSRIPAWSAWVVTLLIIILSTPYGQSFKADMKWWGKQREFDTRATAVIREDITPEMAEAIEQFRGHHKRFRNTNLPESVRNEALQEANKWRQHLHLLQREAGDPLSDPLENVVKSEEPAADSTAATATTVGDDTKPPTAKSSKGGIMQGMGRTLEGARGWVMDWFTGLYSATGTPIALLITIALLAYQLYCFIMYGVVALWNYFHKGTEGMTPDELKKHKESRKLAFGRTFWMPVIAVLTLMFLYPGLASIERWTRDGGFQRTLKDLDTPNAGRVSAASVETVPASRTARRNDPTDGRIVLKTGRITDQQLRESSLVDTGFTADQPFEIFISRNTVQNGYSLPCGFDGCTAQQVEGALLCPDLPHMVLVAQIGDGIKYGIKQASAFRDDKLPEEAQTLRLGVNQALDEWARKNQNGGFEYTIVAAR